MPTFSKTLEAIVNSPQEISPRRRNHDKVGHDRPRLLEQLECDRLVTVDAPTIAADRRVDEIRDWKPTLDPYFVGHVAPPLSGRLRREQFAPIHFDGMPPKRVDGCRGNDDAAQPGRAR